MIDWVIKNTGRLRAATLLLMLIIPFLLYAAAEAGSGLWVKLLMAAMAVNMLLVMKTG